MTQPTIGYRVVRTPREIAPSWFENAGFFMQPARADKLRVKLEAEDPEHDYRVTQDPCSSIAAFKRRKALVDAGILDHPAAMLARAEGREGLLDRYGCRVRINAGRLEVHERDTWYVPAPYHSYEDERFVRAVNETLGVRFSLFDLYRTVAA